VHASCQTIAQHLDILLRLGATPTTIDEIAQAVAHGTPLPRFSASITFDDAYANVVTNALPLLEAKGFRATVFAPADFIGTDQLLWNDQVHALVGDRPDLVAKASSELGLDAVESAHELLYALKDVPDKVRRGTVRKLEDWSALPGYPRPGSSRVCTEAELKELVDHGWSIGSHTLTHPMLTRLPDVEAWREIAESYEQIAELVGERPAGFAYPDGAFSGKHMQMVEGAGYDFAVTTAGRLTDGSQPRHALSRIYPQPTRSRFICLVTGVEQRLRRLLRL
jgi:peptidoglycan/xylan/chitin deacetylase (PgdA/CDA1 family)